MFYTELNASNTIIRTYYYTNKASEELAYLLLGNARYFRIKHFSKDKLK